MLKTIVKLSGKTERLDRLKYPDANQHWFDPDAYATGPRGGRLPLFDDLYAIGVLPPEYPVPAIVYKLQPMKTGIGLIARNRRVGDGGQWTWVA